MKFLNFRRQKKSNTYESAEDSRLISEFNDLRRSYLEDEKKLTQNLQAEYRPKFQSVLDKLADERKEPRREIK